MSDSVIRDIRPDDEYYVSTCSHVEESEEIDASAGRRRALLRGLVAHGGRFKAALVDGRHVGFAHGVPIDRSSWGPIGHNLMVIPCLCVARVAAGRGIGRALIESIEGDARDAGFAGVTIPAYRDIPGAEWFMPAAYFERIGYRSADERGLQALLWRPFHDDAEPPRLLEPRYAFEPARGAVVVDLFWNDFCQTSGIEAERVREVCAEFGDRVVLREYDAEDRETLLRYEVPRAIYVDGEEIFWGHEAPRDGIRAAIEGALAKDG